MKFRTSQHGDATTSEEQSAHSCALWTGAASVGSQRGFTLIELLVSISIFILVATVSISALLVLLDANRKTQSLEIAINNTFFGLESMTRLIRTGYAYYCTGSADAAALDLSNKTAVNDCPDGEDEIVFTDDTDRRVRFYLNDKKIMRELNNDGEVLQITADNFEISSMKFYVNGSEPYSVNQVTPNKDQPVVTIVIRGSAKVGDQTTDVNLEMTATQRLLDL